LAVDLTGNASLLGVLPDGSRLLQRTKVSSNHRTPIYVSLQGGKGEVIGWLHVRPAPDTDLSGYVYWLRGAGTLPTYYTNGFLLPAAVLGSAYSPPGFNRVLNLDSGNLILEGGNLASSFTNHVAFGPGGSVLNLDSSDLKVTLVPNLGMFRGTVTPAGPAKPVSFQGTFLQNQTIGGGFFPGTNRIGRLSIAP